MSNICKHLGRYVGGMTYFELSRDRKRRADNTYRSRSKKYPRFQCGKECEGAIMYRKKTEEYPHATALYAACYHKEPCAEMKFYGWMDSDQTEPIYLCSGEIKDKNLKIPLPTKSEPSKKEYNKVIYDCGCWKEFIQSSECKKNHNISELL